MGRKSNSEIREEMLEKERLANRDAFKRRSSKISIHDAAESGNLDALKDILEFNPAAIYLKHDIGYGNALHFAAKNGHLECVRFLIEKGCAVNGKMQCADTPLHLACMNGHIECARLLLEANADTSIKNYAYGGYADTPRDVAAQNSFHAIVALIDEYDGKRQAMQGQAQQEGDSKVEEAKSNE